MNVTKQNSNFSSALTFVEEDDFSEELIFDGIEIEFLISGDGTLNHLHRLHRRRHVQTLDQILYEGRVFA